MADWRSSNPVLEAGEPGFETDTKKLKMGNGSSAWNDLPYFKIDGGELDGPTTISVVTSQGSDVRVDAFTQSGSNVGVGLTFSSVIGSGTTTVAKMTSPGNPSLPGNFYLSDSLGSYSINTTATFSGGVLVKFVLPSSVTQEVFNSVRIFKLASGVTTDVTVSSGQYSPDFTTRTICASVTSFSDFYIIPESKFNYATDGSGGATITGYTGSGESETIPSLIGGVPVTKIGDNAFHNANNLTSVTIPESVTSIGSNAFDGCNSLANITIPSGVTSIGDQAFIFCNSLTEITIPSGVTSIGNGVFYGCTSLANITIPYGVTSIGGFAFLGCASLTNIVIPSSVTTIVSLAFDGCTGLTAITIPSSVTNIWDNAFSGCTGLTETSITVESGNQSFKVQDGLLYTLDGATLVACPAGMTGEITVPSGVTSVGAYAFAGCVMTAVTIPSSVTSIGLWAFQYCTGLTAVTISPGLASIGRWAFGGCTGLTSITLPSSLALIGGEAFVGCTNLTSIYFGGNAPICGELPFYSDVLATAYYLEGSTGWTNPWSGIPTALYQ